MARPTKWRKIENIPLIQCFIPSQKDETQVSKNILKLEELEAIRLKDLEGLEQEGCAQRMGVSRPTFQRILCCARAKIADSLIKGKAICIAGGNFTRNICIIKCLDCGNEWMDSYENVESIKSEAYLCPDCDSNNVKCAKNCEGKACVENCYRYIQD